MPSLAQRLLLDLKPSPATADDNRAEATNPIASWKLNETSGSTITDSSGNGRHGSYSNVTLNAGVSPFGDPAPLFVPASNSYGNLYSASLASAFDFDEGCMLIWAKVRAASVWTDATARRFLLMRRDSNNQHQMFRGTVNTRLTYGHTAGANANTQLYDTASPTGWFSLMMSWSLSGNTIDYYFNGVSVGSDSGNVIATGSGLDASLTLLGAASTTTLHWDGYLSRARLWDKPADASMIALGVL